MANKTHRWMPTMNIKMIGPHKRVNSSVFTTNILRRAHEMLPDPCGYICPKFENSLYFEKNRKEIVLNKTINLIKDEKVSKETDSNKKNSKSHLNFRRAGSVDSMASNETEIKKTDRTTLKLSDYMVLRYPSDFSKCMNLKLRSYIVSDDKEIIDSLTDVLECFKNGITVEEWVTFRIILLDQRIDIKSNLISNYAEEASVGGRTSEAMPERRCSDESLNSIASGSTMNSRISVNSAISNNEADRKLQNRSKQMYRDSCIIAHNRLTVETPIDPIAKCFEGITKLVEDEIFSIHNHVAAHVEELGRLIDLNDNLNNPSTSNSV